MPETRLRKGLFSPSSPATGLFGLHYGITRSSGGRIAYNTSWYNRYGDQFGFGDLEVDDARRIVAELEAGEFFIVLPELEGSRAPNNDSPGIDYVVEHCHMVLTREKLFILGPRRNLPIDGIACEEISREALKKMLVK